MKRREFMTLVSGAALSWPLTASAQVQTLPVIGWLNSASSDEFGSRVMAFSQGLKEVGFTIDDNVRIEYHWAEGHFDRLPDLAADLIHRGVAIIAAGGSPNSAKAAKSATTTIPIVFVNGGDPVADGIVTSLNRPGGNITGVTFIDNELAAKRFGQIRYLIPTASLVAVLVNPRNAHAQAVVGDAQQAARTIGQKIVVLNASSEHEIELAFESVRQQQVSALVVDSDGFFRSQTAQLIALSAKYTLPVLYPDREYTLAGGLMSYGASIVDAYRQCGLYVGQILKGTKPADLPVQRPTKFELMINLRTAKALSLNVPPSLLATADEVIE